MDARERDLLAALALKDDESAAPEDRAEAAAYVDAVFQEYIREVQVASLERALAGATDLQEIRTLASQIGEIRSLPLAS